jgi:outer membrane lipoprotein-sorting protein
MQLGRKIATAAIVALALWGARAASAADSLDSVLAKLDRAAENFHSTSAEFEFDSVQTCPVPDTEKQTGTVYYERSSGVFRMGIHIREVDGKPAPKVVVAAAGKIQMYEPTINQVTTLNKLSQYESWFMLGFGASGKDLKEKWEIKYLGKETVDGVSTDKLEMVPKDPAIKSKLPKVTVWMDSDRGVSLKQHFDEGDGQSRDALYSDIKMNQSLPADAFTFKENKATTHINK